jgi:hypothetical protein
VFSLSRYVSSLTYYAALRDMGITDRATSRAIFDAVTNRAELPAEVERAGPYQSRKEVRDLFEYMRGFRDYRPWCCAHPWRPGVETCCPRKRGATSTGLATC